MKRIYFLTALLVLGALFSSCSKKKALKCVPENADAVVVVCLDKDATKSIDDATIDDLLKEMELKSSEKDFIKRIVKDPKSFGLDISKAMVGWTEIDKKDLDKTRYGIAIPVKDVDKFKSSLSELNNLLKGSDIKLNNIKQQGDISYVCPVKEIEDHFILGWSKKMLVILASEDGKVTPADVENAINRDKGSSILANKDFKKFSKDLTHFNVWVKTDVFADLLKDEMDSELKDLVKETGVDLKDNYFHAHLSLDKKAYKLEMSLVKNESLQNLDLNKLLQAFNKMVKKERERQEKWEREYYDRNKYDYSYDYDDYSYDYDYSNDQQPYAEAWEDTKPEPESRSESRSGRSSSRSETADIIEESGAAAVNVIDAASKASSSRGSR